MKSLVINLAGAPGAGKSTLATEIFSKLKKLGYNCEYVDEYAKHVVYEENYSDRKSLSHILDEMGVKIATRFGFGKLKECAKLNFKNTAKIQSLLHKKQEL